MTAPHTGTSSPRSSKARRWLPLLLTLLCIPLGWQLAAQWRWASPLYCIGQRGKVWGAVPLTPNMQPTCPQSGSYRQEVRRGETRVEQYRLKGWQPKAAVPLLQESGYVLLTKELNSAGSYSAFLGRQVPGELQYTAVQDGPDTLITISGG